MVNMITKHNHCKHTWARGLSGVGGVNPFWCGGVSKFSLKFVIFSILRMGVNKIPRKFAFLKQILTKIFYILRVGGTIKFPGVRGSWPEVCSFFWGGGRILPWCGGVSYGIMGPPMYDCKLNHNRVNSKPSNFLKNKRKLTILINLVVLSMLSKPIVFEQDASKSKGENTILPKVVKMSELTFLA